MSCQVEVGDGKGAMMVLGLVDEGEVCTLVDEHRDVANDARYYIWLR